MSVCIKYLVWEKWVSERGVYWCNIFCKTMYSPRLNLKVVLQYLFYQRIFFFWLLSWSAQIKVSKPSFGWSKDRKNEKKKNCAWLLLKLKFQTSIVDFAVCSQNVISHVTSMIRTTEKNHKDMRFFTTLLSETLLYIWYCKNFVTLDAGKQTSHSWFFFSYLICFCKSRVTASLCTPLRHMVVWMCTSNRS